VSSATNKNFSQGEIINFISVDVDKIISLVRILPLVSRFPIQLVLSIVLLYSYFGYSLFCGLGCGFIFFFINYLFAKARANFQEKTLKEKDGRMRTTTEIINNIKVIKLNSWIEYFVDKVTTVRNKELYLMKINIVIGAIIVGISRLVSASMIISIFTIYF